MMRRGKSQFALVIITAFFSLAIGIAATLGVIHLVKAHPDEMASMDHADHAMDEMATTQPTAPEDEILYWTCGMHPSVRSDGPGKCPICFMDLVPVYASDQAGGSADDILARLQINEQGRALAMIETVPVAHRDLEHEINTTGRLTLDESRVTHIHSRIGGWIDEVFVEFTGVNVAPGAPLVSIYSEELVTAQEEYLLALRGVMRMADNSSARLRESSETLLESARLRLQRWEITDAQIDDLGRTGQPQEHVTLYYDAPPDTPEGGVVVDRAAIGGMRVNRGDRLYTVADFSTLWMMADVYEYEMAWIALGQEVEITTRTYPGRVFHGEIAFIEPTLDPMTRSVKVRVDVDNPNMGLRPEMWVDARIRIPLDQSNEVLMSLRESAQQQWTERMGQGEMQEMATGQPTTQPSVEPDHAHEAAYLCPMLDGGESDEPGQSCPLCGMIMLPREEVLGPEPTSLPSSASTILSIPDSAVLRTGQREVVYVEEEPGVYTGREVIVGPSGRVMVDGQRELYVPVLAGLEEGMRVVTRGNFLLDSQTTLTGGAAAAYGSALGTGDESSMPPGMPGMQH